MSYAVTFCIFIDLTDNLVTKTNIRDLPSPQRSRSRSRSRSKFKSWSPSPSPPKKFGRC
ncbi:hypothetical protein Dimus_003956 [Dionaea muscipula]